MPKLDEEKAAHVDLQVAWVPPPPLPDGWYTGTLLEVLARSTRAGSRWWDWVFHAEGRELTFYTKLANEDWAWQKFKMAFNAFGVSTETNTDELVGRQVRLRVSQEPDDRSFGELVNKVVRLLPVGQA